MTNEELLLQLEQDIKIAQSRQAIAEANQKAAVAQRDSATAQADTARAAEKADAEHRKTVAEAAQKQAEAKKLTDSAERDIAAAEEVARRDAEKAAAETRKTVAEADVAAIKAYLPSAPTLKPLEGTVTADDKSGIVAETVAYALLYEAAAKIAQELPEGTGMRILLVTEQDLVTSDWQYASIMRETNRLNDDLNNLIQLLQPLHSTQDSSSAVTPESQQAPEPPPADQEIFSGLPAAIVAASALPSIVGAAADVVGYFQSNFKIAGREVLVKSETFLTSMAGALASHGYDVVVDGFHLMPEKSKVLNQYDILRLSRWNLISRRVAAETDIATEGIEIDKVRVELTKAQDSLTKLVTAEPADQPGIEKQAEIVTQLTRNVSGREETVKRLRSVIDVAKAAETKVETFMTSVTASPAGGGRPPLAQAAIRELLHRNPHDDTDQPWITHILQVSVPSIGGETQTRERRFRAPVLRYVGACALSAIFATRSGEVKYARTRTLTGQLTYTIKDGEIGTYKSVEIVDSAALEGQSALRTIQGA